MPIGLLDNTDTERQSIFWEQFLLQESSLPLFFVGLWPYCGGCPISVTGEATTDTTGSHINSKQKQDPSNALVVNDK